jgi:steroid delta-isomerase-like uncharacterized protein
MGIGRDLWNKWETLSNEHDWAALPSLFTSDAVYRYPFGRQEGREAIGAYYAVWRNAFSDDNIETSLVVEDGDAVVAEWMYRATVTGQATMAHSTQIAATGKRVEVAGVTVGTVRDGKFATMRDYYDTAPAVSELGLMPSP